MIACDPPSPVCDPSQAPLTPPQLIERARGRTGFLHGYDFMDFLSERGWSPLAGKGKWPDVIYMQWVAGEGHATARYREGELTVWTFETAASARRHFAGLRSL